MSQTVAEKRWEKLDNWLERVGAFRLWSQGVNDIEVTAYLINTQVALVTKSPSGWDLYVPASNCSEPGKGSNCIESTLDGAAIALGVQGCRGL